MQKTTPKASSPLGKIVCSTIGHNYKVTIKINEVISEYRCACCGHEVSDTVKGSLEVLTPKIKDVNACLSAFIKKKLNRSSYS